MIIINRVLLTMFILYILSLLYRQLSAIKRLLHRRERNFYLFKSSELAITIQIWDKDPDINITSSYEKQTKGTNLGGYETQLF